MTLVSWASSQRTVLIEPIGMPGDAGIGVEVAEALCATETKHWRD